jgi:hypothetical protein
MSRVGELARARGAAFVPSGAGGGDVAIWLGRAAPDEDVHAIALKCGMRPLSIAFDRRGVHAVDRGE